MWTYLAILFSVVLFLAVFGNRAYHFKKSKNKSTEVIEKEEEAEDLPTPEKISRSDRDKVVELCELADKKLKAGKEDEAVKYFVQALAIDALHVEAQHKLAMLYMQKQMFGAAAALFKQLGDLTEEAVHYSHLGLALYQQNEFTEAKEAYQKAIMLDESRPQRFVSLAQVYRAMKQYQNAIIALNKAFELEQENMDYTLLLADMQIELGNYEEARELLGRVLTMDPENEFANSTLKELELKEKALREDTKTS